VRKPTVPLLLFYPTPVLLLTIESPGSHSIYHVHDVASIPIALERVSEIAFISSHMKSKIENSNPFALLAMVARMFLLWM
jgi:hypothetical protein